MVWALPQRAGSMLQIQLEAFHVCSLTSLQCLKCFGHDPHRVLTIRPTDAGRPHCDVYGAHYDLGLFKHTENDAHRSQQAVLQSITSA